MTIMGSLLLPPPLAVDANTVTLSLVNFFKPVNVAFLFGAITTSAVELPLAIGNSV